MSMPRALWVAGVIALLLAVLFAYTRTPGGGATPTHADGTHNRLDPTPPTLRGNPRTADGGTAGATIPVEVLCECPEGERLNLWVFAGTSPADAVEVAVVGCGSPRIVEVPPTTLYWYAGVDHRPYERMKPSERPAYWQYEDAVVTLESLAPNDRVTLSVRRGGGVLRVLASTPTGEPVGLVQLELVGPRDPSPTRVLTDERGMAVWTDVARQVIRSPEVRVSARPPGMSVIEEPRLVEPDLPIPLPASQREVLCRVVLAICDSRLRGHVADFGWTTILCERLEADGWRDIRVVQHGYIDLVPDTVGWDDPAPLFWLSDWQSPAAAPVSGYFRGSGLLPGRYRVTLVGRNVGVQEAEVAVGVRETAIVEEYQQLPSVRLDGALAGPAAGRATRGAVEVLEARGTASRFVGLGRFLVPFGSDGNFEIDVPEGILSYTMHVKPSTESGTPYFVLPEVQRAMRNVVFQSMKGGTMRGRLVGGDGGPLGDVQVSAQVEPTDARGRVIVTRSRQMPVDAVRTREDGTWGLGPGPPGVWHVAIQAGPGDYRRHRFVVREGVQEVVGDIEVVTAPVPGDG